MSDFRTIFDDELDHTYTKSVDNKLHSVLGSDMLNNQSNNSFSSHKFKSEVDVNVCNVPHKSDTVCNFNAYIDALLYDDFDFAVYPDSQSPPPRELEQMRNCGINFIYIYMFVYAISFN